VRSLSLSWRPVGLALLAALVGASVASPVATAAAAAPADDRRVIAGVHADLVSVGLVEGALQLGSRTDGVDGPGVAVDPAAVVFNVESAARVVLGRGSTLGFLGDIGNDFWIAPQSNPDGALLWPGVSTEDVLPGSVDGDVTVSLAAVEGPGSVSVYRTDALGEHERLLDSRVDEGVGGWALAPGSHAHASWAFSDPGAYVLTMAAEASVQGVDQRVEQDYHVFVGAMQPAAATSLTAPSVNTAEPVVGDPVTLTSRVSPATARGYVTFATEAGHIDGVEVVDGLATLVTDRLPLGRQLVSATFFPDSTDDFEESVSSPTVVTVQPARAPGSFGIAPLPDVLRDGDTMRLEAVGEPPRSGENHQWVMRAVGTDRWEELYDERTYQFETGPTLTRVATTDWNGWEIALRLERDHLVLAQSAPVAPVVSGESIGTGLEVSVEGLEEVYPFASYARLSPGGAPLPDGAQYEWLRHYPRSADPWQPYDLGDPENVLTKTFYVPEESVLPIGLRIVGADGTVLGTSPRYVLRSEDPPQLALEGVATAYAPGDVLEATAIVSPADASWDLYQWSVRTSGDGRRVIEGQTGPTLSLPLDLDLDGAQLDVALVEPTRGEKLFAGAQTEIHVFDPAAADRLSFGPLARHYHSGDTVDLHLVSSSVSADDSYRWYLQRQDQQERVLLPGITGTSHQLTAEVALAGAVVSAELVDDAGTVLAAAEAHVAVDDHGTPPPRALELTADREAWAPGETATFTAQAVPGSVLDRHEWWLQEEGKAEPRLVDVTRSGELSIALDAAQDGAQLFARLTKETTETYSESDRLTLRVTAEVPAPGVPAPEVPAPGVPAPEVPAPEVPAPGQPAPEEGAGGPGRPGTGPAPDASSVPLAPAGAGAADAAQDVVASPREALAWTGGEVLPLAGGAVGLLGLGSVLLVLRARHAREGAVGTSPRSNDGS